jgi:hypothetical protein
MREAKANALRSTKTLIRNHTARIIPPTDIKGLAHALHNQIILLLIDLHTEISAAMAMKRTPTVHVTAIQTSATRHKKPIEDTITRNLASMKTIATELIHIVRILQTA